MTEGFVHLYFASRTARNSAVVAIASFALLACGETPPKARAKDPTPNATQDPRGTFGAHLSSRTAVKKIGSLVEPTPLETESKAVLREIMPSKERTERLLHNRRHAWTERSNADRLVPAITGATFDHELGQTMVNLLASLPEERRQYGLSALTGMQLYGNCEDPELLFDTQHEGETYEVRYRPENFTWVTEPVPSLYALSSTCTAALLATGGQVGNAVNNGCSLEDQEAHFSPGSTCRRCLDVDGDHARCVATSRCKPEMTREMLFGVGNQRFYFDVMEAVALACAPNLTAEIIILANELGEDNDPVRAFDHGAVSHYCQWLWNGQEPSLYCNSGQPNVNIALSDVLNGWVVHIRKPGDTRTPYLDRFMAASSAEVEGMELGMMPLYPGTLAEVSVPEMANGGWGMNPQRLRPGRTNPDDLDSTFAPDWLAAVGLKTATNISFVPIVVYNNNLCTDEMWRGPDAQGRYFCEQATFDEEHPPADYMQWNYDWSRFTISQDPLTVEPYPLVTLGATGSTDPAVPGGHLPHILGTSVLADEDWENCAWPETFEPDEQRVFESSVEDVHQFTGQTYRFGKDSRLDMRMVLATNTRRQFCFEPIDD